MRGGQYDVVVWDLERELLWPVATCSGGGGGGGSDGGGMLPEEQKGGGLLFWDLLFLIVECPPPPLPPECGHSDAFADLVPSCMQAEGSARPAANQLLAHPWLECEREAGSLTDWLVKDDDDD